MRLHKAWGVLCAGAESFYWFVIECFGQSVLTLLIFMCGVAVLGRGFTPASAQVFITFAASLGVVLTGAVFWMLYRGMLALLDYVSYRIRLARATRAAVQSFSMAAPGLSDEGRRL